MPHRPARVRAAVAMLATVALSATLLTAYAAAPAGADDVPDPVATVVEAGKAALVDTTDDTTDAATDAARQALGAVGDVQRIVEGHQRGDLTMALREVANTRDALTGADRRRADALLARPTSSAGDGTLEYRTREATPICSPDICVHYVRTTPDAPSLRDTNANGRPDYVEAVLAVLTEVHDAYLRAGYREPKADGNRGGNAKIDVYLGNLGVNGLYGYCTSDDPSRSRTTFDRWAYCALDNDYSRTEFPTNTPLENLQVTVAHEYFHATQYAYDRYEDSWFLEATATWAEDEMYDAVDDNVQYLRAGPMARPRTPLDSFGGGFHYGTWAFFRFLTEKYPVKQGRLPRLVLDMWRKADGARGRPDQYSWQAVDTVLRTKRTTAARMFGNFAVANRRPATSYSEGRANRYPVAPLIGRGTVRPRRGVQGTLRLSHLTSATARLTPQGLAAPGWKLRLAFDLPATVRGSAVLVTSATKAGKITTSRVALGARGNGVKRIPFSSSRYAWVEVTLVNASGRFDCFRQTGSYSCHGDARDERQPMSFTAVAVR